MAFIHGAYARLCGDGGEANGQVNSACRYSGPQCQRDGDACSGLPSRYSVMAGLQGSLEAVPVLPMAWAGLDAT